MERIEELIGTAEEKIKEFIQSPEKYIQFLITAANNYSYNFMNQVLIHINKPQAKAVATYEEWNNKFHRYVNKGAKAFGILDLSKREVKRVLDYSDTNRFDGREIHFWQINEENHLFMKSILAGHGYLSLENEEVRILTDDIAKQIKGISNEKDELYCYIRASVYALLLARTNPEQYPFIENYIDTADFRFITKLDLDSIMEIGGKIWRYVYGILDELRQKENEIKKNGIAEHAVEEMWKDVIKWTEEIARLDFGHGTECVPDASEEFSRICRIYAENNTELKKELIQTWMDAWRQAEKDVRREHVQMDSLEIVGNGIITNIAVDEKERGSNETPHNYRITDLNLEIRNSKSRYQSNIAAIRLLKDLEKEGRAANPEEQEILSKYVGWGGISEVFDADNTSWRKEYIELNELLTPLEYRDARESVLSAFYTQPVIIQAIYKALDKYGFEGGRILEPSCGIGHFFGMLPEEMQNSHLYGIEKDDLTGRIAKQLYQNADISIDGYENTDFPDGFFDVAVGNVPFGQFTVSDRCYDKYGFLIHDYFFAKTLDKVRGGGIIALITSKGTMDKRKNNVRKYIAERAELLGAIRLPSNAFRKNAGTEAIADIIFLKKREERIDFDLLSDEEKSWTYLGYNYDGFEMNEYFATHPEMILGTPRIVSGKFGPTLDIKAKENESLEKQLLCAIHNLTEYTIEVRDEDLEENASGRTIIPAIPGVRNYSYVNVGDELYFCIGKEMKKVENTTKAVMDKIRWMIPIRDSLRNVISLQTENAPDEDVIKAQEELNKAYDYFCSRFGFLSDVNNAKCFSEDSASALLASLEGKDKNGKIQKSPIFSKRTISPNIKIEHVDTARDALIICYQERGRVDIPYMMRLTGKEESEIVRELRGQIYPLPDSEYECEETGRKTYIYQLESEYLSGNVREKLRQVNRYLEKGSSDPVFERNREALENVQPKDLTPADITVRLGATWIPVEYYTQFIHEKFEVRGSLKNYIYVDYEPLSNTWVVAGKNMDVYSINAGNIWGTKRRNGYEILEACLNQRAIEVLDTVEIDGKKKSIKNSEETMKAQEKQDRIQEAFSEWIWEDYERREHLTRLYNEKFNSIVPRRYDGEFIRLNNANNEIKLRDHQKAAIAHALYGGNTLFDHPVGAGKSYEMIVTAMESKRLGICSKPLIVVPNHLVMQMGQEFMDMYPGANILIADKKSFEKQNRKKFCSRIATGEWDCIIMAHSQLEKIPMSKEWQERHITDEIDAYEAAIKAVKKGNVRVKALEASKKSLETRLKRLTDDSRKDDVITFEELGVDRLIIDEAHAFKNCTFPTRMSNVSGVGSVASNKAMDLLLKTEYLNEKTNHKGVVFATGTPISNSLSELFVMQKYLQPNRLKEKGISYFDSWAAVFGSVETNLELTPEGTGYRMKSRFCKYQNIPDLLSMFHEFADVRTVEELDIPVPEVEEINVVTKRSNFQKDVIESLGERAEDIRNGKSESSIDNMLVVTNDGRKVALDQRLIDPDAPDEPDSKVNSCVSNILQIYKKTEKEKMAQVVFCDLSTPKKDGSFNVYDDLKKKLISGGVNEAEIAFIQDAGTGTQADRKKQEIFQKVKRGEVRVLIGSTEMMGTGANMQDRLYALHHLDCPWRPSDMEQREGRIIRFGNLNKKVKIFKYLTAGTFDAYMFQLLEQKQKFIAQIQTGIVGREYNVTEDKTALNYAEAKALCTENPLIKEKMDLDMRVAKLRKLARQHKNECFEIEKKVRSELPREIEHYEERIQTLREDIQTAEENTIPGICCQSIKIQGNIFENDTDATKALLKFARNTDRTEVRLIGEYRGFPLKISYDSFANDYMLHLVGASDINVRLGVVSALKKMDNAIARLPENIKNLEEKLDNAKTELENGRKKINIPFTHEEELKEKSARLKEVNMILERINRGETDIKEEESRFSGEDRARQGNIKKDSDMSHREEAGEQNIVCNDMVNRNLRVAPELMEGRGNLKELISER